MGQQNIFSAMRGYNFRLSRKYFAKASEFYTDMDTTIPGCMLFSLTTPFIVAAEAITTTALVTLDITLLLARNFILPVLFFIGDNYKTYTQLAMAVGVTAALDASAGTGIFQTISEHIPDAIKTFATTGYELAKEHIPVFGSALGHAISSHPYLAFGATICFAAFVEAMRSHSEKWDCANVCTKAKNKIHTFQDKLNNLVTSATPSLTPLF